MAKKKAAELTTTQALDRVFGKGAAKKLRAVLQAEDAQKGRKQRPKPKGKQP